MQRQCPNTGSTEPVQRVAGHFERRQQSLDVAQHLQHWQCSRACLAWSGLCQYLSNLEQQHHRKRPNKRQPDRDGIRRKRGHQSTGCIRMADHRARDRPHLWRGTRLHVADMRQLTSRQRITMLSALLQHLRRRPEIHHEPLDLPGHIRLLPLHHRQRL